MGTANAFDLCPSKMDANYGQDFTVRDDLAECVSGGDENIHAFKADTSPLSDFVPKAKLRRVDHYSRMALLACGRALKDTDPALFFKEKTGVILATGYGALSSTFSFLDSYIEKGDKLAFPTHFSNSVHNAAAAYISINYGIQGPSLTVSQFDLSFFSALTTAGAWLETGKTDAVLVGTADAYCDVLGYCIGKFSSSAKCLPYSFGEGAAFFLVTRETENQPRYGYMDGITMGQAKNIKIPPDTDIIISSSSTGVRGDKAKEDLAEQWGKLKARRHGFSPTDSSMDAVYALKEKKRACCIKLAQNGRYGKMTITPGVGKKE
ncbi:MAG: beta-ketoacyl synthase [Desulfobacteraceae bacterium]|nr:beta-ketoacyl synthase [Desulfobacteraceae bacterium]